MPTSPDLGDLCADIRVYHRRRVFAMRQRMANDNRLLRFIALELGWSRGLPERERKRIEALSRQIAAGKNDDPAHLDLIGYAHHAREGSDHFVEMETQALRQMKILARQLPVWSAFAHHVRGFGEGGLATIVGEAGDLAAYPKKGHLWKRMGVAVIGAGDGLADRRQGDPGPAAMAVDWTTHGYNAQRRSRLFVIGESLLRARGEYHQLYLARRAYEITAAEGRGLTVTPAGKIPKAEAHLHLPLIAVHRRAQRYMEKRLLKDLWQAWRGAGHRPGANMADDGVPAPVEPIASPGPLDFAEKALQDAPGDASLFEVAA